MSEPQHASKTWAQQAGCTLKTEVSKHRRYPGALRLNPTHHLPSYDRDDTACEELAHLDKGAHSQRKVQHAAKPIPIAARCTIKRLSLVAEGFSMAKESSAGRNCSAVVRPVAEAESSVRTRRTSQSWATRCIQEPVFAIRAAKNQTR